jgi:hypothetical protein
MIQCTKCKDVKKETEFYANSHKCKECTKIGVRLNYRANKIHYIEYEKQREKTDSRKAFKKMQQSKHRFNNVEKYKARNAVANAIRCNRLKKGNCEICGSINTQAHHEDYSQPLNIRWLCFVCHRAEHGQEAHQSFNQPRENIMNIQQSLF